MNAKTTTNYILLRALILVMMLSGAITNTVFADDDPVTVGDVSNTECASRTRATGDLGHSRLKLTRFENGLYGELSNFEVNCAYGDINVMCQENGQILSINVDEGIGDVYAMCKCQINICFTIFNALQDEYQLKLDDKNIGTVSFNDHSTVEIDLRTLEIAYDGGFDYTTTVNNLSVKVQNTNLMSENDLTESLDFYNRDDKCLTVTYNNYVLPRTYSMLDVQANTEQDSILVINVLTDGIPEQGSQRIADIWFHIMNVANVPKHLRLNHIIQIKDNNGQERTYTVCVYDDDVAIPEYGSTTIPITDNYDYFALISGISPQQLTGNTPDTPVYNLQGQRVTTPQKGGLYIKNGRKFIVH